MRSRHRADPIGRAAAIIAILVCPLSAAWSQTGTNDPVLKRMWAVGMDSSRTWDLAQTLFDSIGPRLAGSERFRSASNWITKTYESWGITVHKEQYGTWRGWRRGHTHVDLIAPQVRSLEATMLAYSPGTGGINVERPTVILPLVKDSAEFARWLPHARGKFVLVSPAYPSCRPESEWQAMATPQSKARMDTTIVRLLHDWDARIAATGYSAPFWSPTATLGVALEKAGAAGIITSNFTDRFGESWGTWSSFETDNRRAPAIAMSCEDYGLLFRLTDRNQHPVLRVNADAQQISTAPAFNTFGVIKGSEKPNEYVLLSAHLDSWDSSQGATDNGTGTIMMMEAMRILKLAYPHPKRTIMVGHWDTEEAGEIGSRAFAYDHPEIVRAIAAGFNQDGGTGRIYRMWGVGLPDGDAHLQKWLSMLPKEFVTQVSYTGLSSPYLGNTDHRAFTCYGAPVFPLGSVRWDNEVYTQHTNRDSFDKIVFDDLKQNATLVAMLAYLASEDLTFISHDRADLNAPSPAPPSSPNSNAAQPTTISRAELSSQLFPYRGGGGASGGPVRDERGWLTTCPRGERFYGDTSNVRAPSERP